MKQQRILHVDMDAFYVEVELLKRPELRGTPVIVGGRPPRGVVSTCSYEARRFGVHSGMASVQAARLCPAAVWLQGDYHSYSEYSRRMIEILRRYSPEVVQLSIDEARVDLTGSELLFGPAPEIADRILKEIRDELGLPASGGLANSGVVAKIASELAKPRGLAVILPGYEKPFLSPLRVERIPGIGAKSLPKFHRFGVHRIGDLAAMPADELERLFGRWTTHLMNVALGKPASVRPGRPASSSRSHEKTFVRDIFDRDIIRMELRRLVERLGYRLRKRGLRARSISVKIRDGKFNTITRAAKLAAPANSDRILFHSAVKLVMNNLPRENGVRLLGVSAQDVAADIRQLDLFPVENHKLKSFYRAVDGIKEKYGNKVAGFGITTLNSQQSLRMRSGEGGVQ